MYIGTCIYIVYTLLSGVETECTIYLLYHEAEISHVSVVQAQLREVAFLGEQFLSKWVRENHSSAYWPKVIDDIFLLQVWILKC